MKLYKNNKNGNLYKIISDAIDCTNERDGLMVVVYSPYGSKKLYVREESEFFEKFIEVVNEN